MQSEIPWSKWPRNVKGCWRNRPTRQPWRSEMSPTLKHLWRHGCSHSSNRRQTGEQSTEPDPEPTERRICLRAARFWDSDWATSSTGKSSFTKKSSAQVRSSFSLSSGYWALYWMCGGGRSWLASTWGKILRFKFGLKGEQRDPSNLVLLVLCTWPAMTLNLFTETSGTTEGWIAKQSFPYMRHPSQIHLSMSKSG